MKFLFPIAIALFIFWLIRQKQKPKKLHDDTTQTPSSVEMLPCAHCGVHVPATDAIRGSRGAYCNNDHQRAAEG